MLVVKKSSENDSSKCICGASGEISLMSPDNTSDGWLRKKWQIIGGARCLQIPHVPYSLPVNEDRHQNNFGVVRNAETLEYVSMAPVYDSGSPLWFSTPTALIRPDAPKRPCPFLRSYGLVISSRSRNMPASA